MKTPARVVAIKCPSCGGDGRFMGEPGFACMWCGGKKKLRKEAALQFSEHIWMLAGGGYIAGDHDLADMRKMEADSDKIRAAFGVDSLRPR